MAATADFSCFNCGARNHFSRNCTALRQQFTRCPSCNNVAKTPAGHKLTCSNLEFKSVKIGEYELPLMDSHHAKFTFKNVESIFVAEKTANGIQNFKIAKFFAIKDTNVKFRRSYVPSNDLIIEMQFKPAISLGFGRLGVVGKPMASIMFAENQVRINHYQHIDRQANVSYNLTANPRKDVSHDIELKLPSGSDVIFFTIEWNRSWTANIAMSSTAFTIGGADSFDRN